MNIADIVGIYGAVIGTVLAARKIIAGRVKLRSSYHFYYTFESNHTGTQIQPGRFVMQLRIVNHGKQTRIISSLSMKLPRKMDDIDALQVVKPGEFPITLSEGAMYTKYVDLRQLLVVARDYNIKKGDSVKFYFQDTLGKKYYTKKVKVANIKNYIDMNVDET